MPTTHLTPERIQALDKALADVRAEVHAAEVSPYSPEQAQWEHDLREASALLSAPQAVRAVPAFDMLAHLRRQAEFSAKTFGPGARVEGVTDHIAKELNEVRESGGALSEWVDVIILAFDGAWRSGATPEQIIDAMVAKQTKNEGRRWPDWRTAPAGKAIEHDRSADAAPSAPQPAVCVGVLESAPHPGVLAQPAPSAEPVARVVSWTSSSYGRNYKVSWMRDVQEGALLYTAPPVRRPLSRNDTRSLASIARWINDPALTDAEARSLVKEHPMIELALACEMSGTEGEGKC